MGRPVRLCLQHGELGGRYEAAAGGHGPEQLTTRTAHCMQPAVHGTHDQNRFRGHIHARLHFAGQQPAWGGVANRAYDSQIHERASERLSHPHG